MHNRFKLTISSHFALVAKAKFTVNQSIAEFGVNHEVLACELEMLCQAFVIAQNFYAVDLGL